MAYSCKFNPWVSCKDRAGCSRCGWNPEETRHRLERRKYPKKEPSPMPQTSRTGGRKDKFEYTFSIEG